MSINAPTLKLPIGGADNRNDAYEIGLNTQGAVNVDLTRAGKARRRAGYAEVYQGTVDAAWGDGLDFLFQSGNVLYRLNAGYTTTALRAGLSPVERGKLAACRVLDRIFWSNGIETGCVQAGANRTWGIAPPAHAPLLAESAGNLLPGRYQCACTFIRSDGQESAAGPAAWFDLAGTGLQLRNLPQSADPGVDTVAVYLTAPDGEQLYLAGYVPNGITSWTFPGGPGELLLQTQFKITPPPGAHIAFYRGAVYVAAGEYLYSSEPFNYELFDARRYLGFGSRITALGAVEDGLYVGTDSEIVFLSGAGIEDFNLNRLAPYGVILNTLESAPASMLEGGGAGNALLFMTPRGVCAGFSGGNLRNITEKNFYPGAATQGAAFWREAGGQSHFVAAYAI